MGKRLTYQEVREFIEGIEGNGCKLLSTEYMNNRTKLQIRCACGKVFETCFDSFKNKPQRQCKECGIKRRTEERRYSYQYVKDYIESVGCELLSTEYLNNKTNLKIKCSCGEVFESRFDVFKNRERSKCPKCNGINEWDYVSVKKFIEDNGCELLSKQYVNNTKIMTIRCNCGKIFYTSFNRFKEQNKRQCNECGILLKSGKNHPRWNVNLTDEERENGRQTPQDREWRNQVYKRDSYTCQCCGDNRGGNLNAHHLNGHNWNEKYRTSKLNGVTLCKKCHNEFHSIYGYGNNTIIQFRDFIYKKYLQTNNPKYLTILKNIDIRITLLVDNLTLSLVN